MNGWLIVNGFLRSEKFNDLYRLLNAAFRAKGASLTVFPNTAFAVPAGEPLTPMSALKPQMPSKDAPAPDFILFWDKDIALARRFEYAGIPVFNSSAAIACCDDKIMTSLALARHGVPTPRTIFAPKTFEGVGRDSFEFVQVAANTLKLPMVIKEACGSFGQQVYLAQTMDEAQDIVRRIGYKDFLMQEFVATSSGQDLRVNVVGREVVAAMRRFNTTDFRSNVTLGGGTEQVTPTPVQRETALAACKAVGADFAGVDILFGPHGAPLVCEVNSNPHFRSTLDCTGVNLADSVASYVLNRCFPRT